MLKRQPGLVVLTTRHEVALFSRDFPLLYPCVEQFLACLRRRAKLTIDGFLRATSVRLLRRRRVLHLRRDHRRRLCRFRSLLRARVGRGYDARRRSCGTRRRCGSGSRRGRCGRCATTSGAFVRRRAWCASSTHVDVRRTPLVTSALQDGTVTRRHGRASSARCSACTAATRCSTSATRHGDRRASRAAGKQRIGGRADAIELFRSGAYGHIWLRHGLPRRAVNDDIFEVCHSGWLCIRQRHAAIVKQ